MSSASWSGLFAELAIMSAYPRGLRAKSAAFAIEANRGFEMSLTTRPTAPVVPVRMLRAETSGR